MPPDKYTWHGKFVSKKVYEHMLRRSENGKKNKALKQVNSPIEVKESKDESAEITSKYPVEGARIVDLKHMSEQMICKKCKKKLHLGDIREETIYGMGSYFKVECDACATIQSVESGPLNKIPGSNRKTFEINAKLPLGAIRAGIGHTQADTFLSTFEIPVLTKNNYKNQERKVGPFIENVAKNSCIHAIELERALTLENLDKPKKLLPPDTPEDFLVYTKIVDGKEVKMVRLFSKFDFGWIQRGNGYSYDSMSGYCALIGELSGMVLAFITFNRKCRQCESNIKNNIYIEHDCRVNHYGTAKSMEAEGARILVIENDLFKEANVEIGVFIADNDSNSISVIQNLSDHVIIKQSDMNHTEKGVSNALYSINSKTNTDPDRELQSDTIKTLKKYFSYAVSQNVGELEKMRAAIKNIPYHAFDQHDNCGSWCKAKEEKENYVGLQLKNLVLFEELKKLYNNLSDNATKFLMAASSNANESLNNSMTSKAPKRICYSTSESCDYRFACTVVQKNYGEAYINSIFHALGFETTSLLTKRIQRCTETASKRKLREQRVDVKKRRIELAQARSQVKYRKEKEEGISYSSHMSLFDVQEFSTAETVGEVETYSEKISYQESENLNEPIVFETENEAVVFFDLETGGFDMFKDEVLQISLKHGHKSYTSYITPTRPINSKSSDVHGLTRVAKNLYKNGQQVEAKSKSVVVYEVLQFLKVIGKKCILAAHKCEFDSRRLVILAKSCDLLRDFQDIVVGFTDTLPLFQKKVVDVENHQLSTLASSKLKINCSDAHDAKFDVLILEELSKKLFTVDDLIKINNGTFADVVTYIDKKERGKTNKNSFIPLQSVISKAMIQRLAELNFSYQDLIDAYKENKDSAINLLKGKVNGSATIIKTKKVLEAICDHLKLLDEVKN